MLGASYSIIFLLYRKVKEENARKRGNGNRVAKPWHCCPLRMPRRICNIIPLYVPGIGDIYRQKCALKGNVQGNFFDPLTGNAHTLFNFSAISFWIALLVSSILKKKKKKIEEIEENKLVRNYKKNNGAKLKERGRWKIEKVRQIRGKKRRKKLAINYKKKKKIVKKKKKNGAKLQGEKRRGILETKFGEI